MTQPDRKLLVIYYNFPPKKVPGALRVYNFCRAAKPFFTDIQALTTSNRHLFEQDPALALPEVPVAEVPAWDLRSLAARRGRGKERGAVSYALKNSPWTVFLRRLLDSFPFNLLIGDGGLLYIIRAYGEGKRLVQEHGITHVFSTFRPYSDHVIAHLLKRRFPQLVWIADFRDLHVDPVTRTALIPRFQLACNRLILRPAQLVTTVSEGLAEHLEALHPRVHVLYNGLESLPAVDEPPVSERFTICYTGALFFEHRDPRPLFQVLATVARERDWSFQLIYAGPDGSQWNKWIQQYDLEDYNRTLGMISLAEARRLQRSAQINLLLTYSTPELKGNLTGKLYEYFAARRPVLGLIKGVPDPEMERIFRALDAGLLVFHTGEGSPALEGFLCEQYARWEEDGRTPDRIPLAALRRFYWPDMVKKMLEELDA